MLPKRTKSDKPFSQDPDNSAGFFMTIEFVDLKEMTVRDALEKIRRIGRTGK